MYKYIRLEGDFLDGVVIMNMMGVCVKGNEGKKLGNLCIWTVLKTLDGLICYKDKGV